MKSIIIGLCSLFVVSSSFAFSSFKATLGAQLEKDHHAVTSYQEARTYLYGHLYLEEEQGEFFLKDLYCHNVISGDDVGPMAIPSALKINAEHIWPQSRFNPEFAFAVQKSDLFNLIPVNPKANAMRGELPYGYGNTEVAGCEAKISKTAFEPADEVKGNIARAMFYFSTRYQLEIDDSEEAILRKWHQLDPADEVEKAMNNRIHEIQGNRNPFIDFPSFVSRVANF